MYDCNKHEHRRRGTIAPEQNGGVITLYSYFMRRQSCLPTFLRPMHNYTDIFTKNLGYVEESVTNQLNAFRYREGTAEATNRM